jgi:hypothetical protein
VDEGFNANSGAEEVANILLELSRYLRKFREPERRSATSYVGLVDMAAQVGTPTKYTTLQDDIEKSVQALLREVQLRAVR